VSFGFIRGSLAIVALLARAKMTIEQQEDSRKDVVSGGTDIPMDDFSGTEPGMTADTEDDVDMIDEIQRDTVEVPDEYDDNPVRTDEHSLLARSSAH